jgi:hypothetical protein
MPVITRFAAGQLLAYDFAAAPATTAVFPMAVFPIAGPEPDSYAVAPGLSRAVYATTDRVTCVGRDGSLRWQRDFAAASTPWTPPPSRCDFSLDGAVVWLYRPDGMTYDGALTDTWLALDAGTGDVRARTGLDTAGQGAQHFAHPDGEHMLLDVGEGQDGTRVFRGRLDGDRIELVAYAWGNRTLISVSPDGSHLMTVDHDNADAAFHTYLDGAVVARVPAEDLGHDEAFIEYAGGYLDDATAVVTVAGETGDEQQWYERHLVDPVTGRVRGRLDAPSAGPDDFIALGDGSWLSTDGEGGLRRHTPDHPH